MATKSSSPMRLPAAVSAAALAAVGGTTLQKEFAWMSWAGTVWRLEGESGAVYVKRAAHLGGELERTKWLAGRLPVPEVLGLFHGFGDDWMLTRAVPGVPLSDPSLGWEQARVARRLGEILRDIHATDATGCPFGERGRREDGCDRPPAAPRGVGSIEPEALARRLQSARGDDHLQAMRGRPPLAYPEIVDGPDIEAAQLKDQEHLGRPTPDPADLHQPRHQIVVRQRVDVFQRHRAVGDLASQIGDRSGLGAAHARRTHSAIREGEDGSGGEAVGEQLEEAAVNRCGGRARELLVHERAG